jgi:hypothetical protein
VCLCVCLCVSVCVKKCVHMKMMPQAGKVKLSMNRTLTDGKAVGEAVGKAVGKAVGERLLSHTEFQVVVGGGVQSRVCRVLSVMHQHTSAYVSIRQHTSAYVSIRQQSSVC